MKALIVEDEQPIREVMKEYLQRAGFEVIEAKSGEVGVLKFDETVSVVVLDLNLPNKDGLEVCKEIRKKSSVPIIIVTARTEEIDELKGLSLGADDYVKKPFSPKVLVAHVQALLRRKATSATVSGGMALDEDRMVFKKDGREIALTTTQFKILKELISQPGKVFTRAELLTATDDEGRLRNAMERTIDAHIKTIRKLIGDDPHNPLHIKTVVGTGYKYTP